MPFLRALDENVRGRGPGPSRLECMLYAGHTGVSVDGGATIFGFNPVAGGLSVWQMLDALKNGDAVPGAVHDDTAVFATARNHPLPVLSFEVVLPDPRFKDFESRLDSEKRQSNYTYGFPNGNGDCNCTTWLERLGLPLLTGRMDELIGLAGIAAFPRRRFGECV